MMKQRLLILLFLPMLFLSAFHLHAETEDAVNDSAAIAKQISDLKEKVIRLNRDLFILQEELLFPAETQVAVFLSVDSGAFFVIDSVELRLDDKKVTHYLYTQHQQQALSRGGVQRLWVGNVKAGEHELVAFFKGLNHEGREMERAAALNFEKADDEAAMLELKVVDSKADMRAHFSIEQW